MDRQHTNDVAPVVETQRASPEQTAAPGNVAARALALQRTAGNQAVAGAVAGGRQMPGVQRWTNPLATTKTDQELIRDAIADTDLTAIRSIRDFSGASESDRLKMIDLLVTKGWIVGDALLKMWKSFDDASFDRLVAADPARWANSVKKDSSLKTELPRVKELFRLFPEDVRATAQSYLTTNLQVVRQQQVELGLLTFDNGGAPAPMTDEVNDRIVKMQAAAASIAKLQMAQEAARTVPVGWGRVQTFLSTSGEASWAEESFSPYHPPETEQQPPGPGTKPSAGHQPYAAIKVAYDAATAKVGSIVAAFPALYAVSRIGDSAQTSAFAKIASPQQARAALGPAMDMLANDIKGAQTKLKPNGGLDPLDLTPVHGRLVEGGASSGGSTTNWSQPLAKWAGKEAARDHALDEALVSLGLDLAIQAAFLLAPFTGGASLLFASLAALAQAGKTAAAMDKADALAQAAKTSVTKDSEIVDPAMVDAATMAADAEKVALALSVFAVAAEAVGAAIKGVKAPEVKAGGRVGTEVPGLFDAIDPKKSPDARFEFTDAPMSESYLRGEGAPPGTKAIRTTVTYTDAAGTVHGGQRTFVERWWDPGKKQLSMPYAFLDGLPKEANKIKMTPSLTTEGTPLQTFLTLRQMKLLGAGRAAPEVVKLSTIQNVKTIAQVAEAERNGVAPAQSIRDTHSFKYAETNTIQSGQTITKVEVKAGVRTPFSELLEFHEQRNPANVEAFKKILADHGLKRTDEVLWNFDIYLDVEAAPPPAGAEPPSVVVPTVAPQAGKDPK